jgi:hypothetical protein
MSEQNPKEFTFEVTLRGAYVFQRVADGISFEQAEQEAQALFLDAYTRRLPS